MVVTNSENIDSVLLSFEALSKDTDGISIK